MRLFYLLFICFISNTRANAQIFYSTPYGTHYHTANCKSVRNPSTKIVKTIIIQKRNLKPCKICKAMYIAIYGTSKKVSGIGTKIRCSANTKKGTRCMISTKNGNKFCWHHYPK